MGVTQLALFDTIIADRHATFETSYATNDDVPTGFCLWKNKKQSHDVLVSISFEVFFKKKFLLLFFLILEQKIILVQ